MKPHVLFLVGPTAVGKTDIAAKLAGKINAEVISCDSMQIYKGMDILTSKPTAAIKKRIPHHLFDLVLPTKNYNVSRYSKEANIKIRKILGRGRVPLIVGGTGFYSGALTDGIFKVKSENSKIRKELYKQAESLGGASLHKKLKKVDPRAASKIHPNDTRRIVRALEVYRVTGKPISELQKERKGLRGKYRLKIFCLNMQRGKLYQKIDNRVDRMFRQGLLSEVKRLLKKGLSRTAAAAIGIKEIKGYLDGAYDLEEAKRLIKRNSRRYAKGQLTWFRRDKAIVWINIKDKESPADTVRRILNKL
ncbi:tRNA (adenosine(37)-N6)-dimethylallyltransferase MiaA [Candidatus Omnitrophota bacterium]